VPASRICGASERWRRRTLGVTIIDVAREAGTSKATVSKVLGNRPYVSKEMRDRVLSAIDRLGYQPNRAAQSLVQGRAHAIGVAISDIRNPFYAALIRVIDEVARAAGNITITVSVEFGEPNRVDQLEAHLRGLVDGIIFASWWGPPEPIRQLEQHGIPFAFVTCRPIGVAVDYVIVDDQRGAELAVEHLATLGHRRIAHISSPDADWSTEQRLSGFISGLEANGLTVARQMIVTAERRKDGFLGRLDGYSAAMGLLHQSDPPTAIFCADDFTALGAMQAIEEAGARIPKDISLVGFDNISLSALPRIGLTTIAHPVEEMGRLVTELILNRVGDTGTTGPYRKVLEPSLVVRGSTGPAPRNR
jgi:LacI family transcriptional regulator